MISIVTDSTCYLPPDFVAAHHITVVPLKIQFGAETFDEITGMGYDAFLRRLATTSDFPTTSQPAIADFKTAYQKILAQQPSAQILTLTVSSKLSGTYSAAATAAAQLPEAEIVVFDSLSAAMGVGLMVMTAVQIALTGGGMADILARLEQMRREIAIFLMVDDLEYLRRGGRIGAAATFLGTLLDTKPILTVEQGLIRPFGRVRTKKKAVRRLFVELQQKLPAPDQPVQAGVMHVAAAADARRLGQMIQEKFNVTYFFVSELGPAIAAHLGPGALAVGFCPDTGE